jgi:hypothetical protein
VDGRDHLNLPSPVAPPDNPPFRRCNFFCRQTVSALRHKQLIGAAKGLAVFMLIGVAITLPLIIGYTAWAY